MSQYSTKSNLSQHPDPEVINVVHVWPDQRDARGHTIPSCFNMVIVCGKPQDSIRRNKGKFKLYLCNGPSNYFPGLQIAQVRMVFQLPSKVLPHLFPSADIPPPTHLAYME
ncbi:hypothetical protein EDB84DRAFT_1276040 [Lactarius hengduanensis]|nr:hypothetical protein EDB84DRAFT_1276040 [Lactarius hengduanensis]